MEKSVLLIVIWVHFVIAIIPIYVEKEFSRFELEYGKKYESSFERDKRMQIFAHNLKETETNNRRSFATWKKGINVFSDQTEQEFRKRMLGGYLNIYKGAGGFERHHLMDKRAVFLPPSSSVDWRKKGAITHVKDQGLCGSCWAFAAVEQLESYVQIETGELEVLSAQQICSCAPNPMKCGGSGGCGGSIVEFAFSYAQVFGIVKESDYNYTSGFTSETGKCAFDATSTESAAYTRGYETLYPNDMEKVMQHLDRVGPLAVAVDATNWLRYSSGVFDGCNYHESITLNHVVQLVGYGTDVELGDYWIVRNSWGKLWGDNGYMLLKMESKALCGLDNSPLMGVGCDRDGVGVQKVCGMCGILFDATYPIGAERKRGIKP